ncbi:hypothetical protein DY000_02008576 [Brassica cretica]|uniref:Uncharacterized protein n=1 Tax=Brassica cretica TaxID=69181 RepID=A0ABQ7CDZ1_BRACR|nr:hypothetical protein DY000_02008576 [Brassica cretica]
MYVVNENNVSVSTLVVRGEGWNKWVRELDSSNKPFDAVCSTQTTTAAGSAAEPSRTVDLTKPCKYHDVKGHYTTECKNKERRAQRKATGKGRHNETQQRDDEEDAPKSNGEADSSADKEQPANRRRIEVILSQQTLSSDDENDDTLVLEDLRDVLKRKFESENSTSSTRSDLRTTLNARKSRRISAVDPDPKERSNGDLKDKLNAGACDLRIRLNRSKPTDLRRRLEQTKMSSNDTSRRHLRRSGRRTDPNARSRATHRRRFYELYHGSICSSRRSPRDGQRPIRCFGRCTHRSQRPNNPSPADTPSPL